MAATSTVTYTYATVGNPSGPYSVGQLVSVANGTSTTSYGNFDALGRAQTSTQTTNGQTYAFGYNYNISELIAEAYPTGRTINISYDGANRESSVYGTTGTTTTNYVGNVAYAAHGAPTSYQYGQVSNGAGKMVRNNIYNPRLQLAGYSDTNNATGTQLVNATLNWLDGNNNDNGSLQGAGYVNGGTGTPASMTFNEAYLYDAANRLKSVTDSSPSGSSTITNWSRTFGYDVFGNMWVLTNSGVTEMGNTPTSNVFTAKNQISGSSYDAAGNQTAVNGNTQTYDAENRQAAVSFAGSTESYGYDGDGRRVSKAVSGTGGAATVYVYDAMGRLAAEYSTGAATSPCATCYLSTDHLGSTRLVVDQNGNVVARHDFLPFGEEVTVGRNGQWGAGNDTISQRFTAKERDAESGLDYFGARYYGSALGRFTSPDPEGISSTIRDPQSWNMYVYGRDNPLTYTDPDGLNYTVCDAQGKNCRILTDQQMDDYRASLQGTNMRITPSGQIEYWNDNGSVTKVGQADYYNERAENAYNFAVWGIKQMALNALAEGAGRAIGTAVEAAFGAIRSLRTGSEVAEDVAASTPVGRRGAPLDVTPGTNSGTKIGDRYYTGHALDRVQGRGGVPSVVEDTIASGTKSPGNLPNTTKYSTSQADVVTNSRGDVVTVIIK